MDFEVVDCLPFPLERVYPTMRDKLPDLVPYLPDVKSITVVEREDLGAGRLRQVSQWMAENRIPRFARALVKPEQLGWLEHAEWNEATHSARYHLEMLFSKEYVDVHGETVYSSTPDGGCQVRLTGTLRLDLAKHPAVPRLLAKAMQSTAERFVLSLIKPNLTKVNRGIEQHLAAQGEKPVK